ncbi:MAG: pyrroline-5-carboxylate reductase [Acidimicrobiia bacterium]|nr:pyrroline-5-carboxylate reductase [Acidimicrobiia bacterium]
MGTALVSGWLADPGNDPAAVTVADVSRDVLERMRRDHGVVVTADPGEAVADSDIVVLAVKQPHLDDACAAIGPRLAPGATVVSIVAGVTNAALERRLPEGTPVVRAMPNTAALVGAAATAIAAGAGADESAVAAAEELLGRVGLVARVPERLMDAVTALSGSGPAYVFYLAEALVEAGVALGLPRDTATRLSEHTIAGAARLLVESDLAPADLRAQVTSPGGTTAAAVGSLEHHAVRAAFLDALEAAALRSRELGEAFS